MSVRPSFTPSCALRNYHRLPATATVARATVATSSSLSLILSSSPRRSPSGRPNHTHQVATLSGRLPSTLPCLTLLLTQLPNGRMKMIGLEILCCGDVLLMKMIGVEILCCGDVLLMKMIGVEILCCGDVLLTKWNAPAQYLLAEARPGDVVARCGCSAPHRDNNDGNASHYLHYTAVATIHSWRLIAGGYESFVAVDTTWRSRWVLNIWTTLGLWALWRPHECSPGYLPFSPGLY